MNSHYVGKDMVHYGSGLSFDPEEVYACLDHSVQKGLRKAEKAGFVVQRVNGSANELNQLRKLWYYPDDPNYPDELPDGGLLYLAWLDGTLAGGVILVPVGNHLFLNNLTASDEGKKHQLQSHLLWHVVNDLSNSQFQYIDVGVSYRLNLQRFFVKWATFRYPVIFQAPTIKPEIKFHPFRFIQNMPDSEACEKEIESFCLGKSFTFFPSISHARIAALATTSKWLETGVPVEVDQLQLIDLTEIFPVQYGALLIGVAYTPEELWDRFSCYDHYKIEYLKKCFSLPEWDIGEISAQREKAHSIYFNFFKNEDVEIELENDWKDGFSFSVEQCEQLAQRYSAFGVDVRWSKQRITLPCHQNITPAEIEYLYAIYRGYLNLCSEWKSTGVKGRLKMTGT